MLAAAALPAAAGAGVDRSRLEAPDPTDLHAFRISDSTVSAPRALQAWGGVYTTARGARVRIEVSDSYPVDEAQALRWAEYLDSLVHGSELERATVFLAPPGEVSRICGFTALACYSPETETIVTPGEDTEGDPTAEAILAHEYGHHVAANRLNPPWDAVSFGTKRWATYMGVCAAVAAGELFPRGPGDQYALDPAEGFAEAYRLLNERRLGRPETPWEIVSSRFYPDDTALALLEQDVLQPWTASTTLTRTGLGNRSFRVGTPLDGTLRIAVRAPRGTVYRVSAPARVCGARTVTVRIQRVKGKGAFRLSVSRP